MAFRKAALWSIGAHYISFAVQFVVSVIISRFFLAPSEVGLFSIGLSVALLVSFLQDFGLIRFIAGQQALDRDLLSSCVLVAFIFCWLVALLLMAGAWPIAHFYRNDALIPLMLVIGGSYLLVPVAIVPVAIAMHDMDFRTVSLVTIIGGLAGGVTSLVLAYSGWSALSLAWGTVATAAARGIVALICRPAPLPRLSNTAAIRRIASFGSQTTILSASSAVGSRSIDLIVGWLLSLTAVGLFSRGNALAGQMRVLVTGAVSGTFYPAFARIRDSGEPISPHYLNIVSGFTAIAWPALAALALAAEPVVLLLYGPGWGGVAPVLRWIAISELILVGVPLHMDLPVLLGRIRTLIRVNMIDTLLSICLLALGAHWGLDYLAASRLAYALIWAAMYLTLLYSIIAFDIGALVRIYAKSACGALAALAPMALVMSQQTAPLGFVMLLTCTIAGIALWLLALHLVRHPAEALIQRELRALTGMIFRTSTPD